MGRLVIQSQAGVDDFDTFAFMLPAQATTGVDIIDT
jgi:hypothetical protein